MWLYYSSFSRLRFTIVTARSLLKRKHVHFTHTKEIIVLETEDLVWHIIYLLNYIPSNFLFKNKDIFKL